MAVVIETTIGDFTVDLYTAERPQMQNGFIAQTGDPLGTGKGGESVYSLVLGDQARYYEAERMPKIKHDRVGLLSMVNCGDSMLGSQFFITLGSDLQSLDGEHCVFGEIAEGLEIILKFNETICDDDHRPYQDIRISHTVILEDPYDDPKGLVVPDRSPEPTKEALMSERIGADEAIDDTAGMSIEEITEMQKEKEAKARATILEIVGDIPDAEMAPPENVLFVCKLNPVTNDDDLEIIFSRFGKIIGCEVIRDRQSGDSLQYAFIEFADRKSCEEAYFKMDNVLIDDRRIHVDFSQSVAKMRWRGKGKGIQYFENRQENKDSEEDRHGWKRQNERFEKGENAARHRKRRYDKKENEGNYREDEGRKNKGERREGRNREDDSGIVCRNDEERKRKFADRNDKERDRERRMYENGEGKDGESRIHHRNDDKKRHERKGRERDENEERVLYRDDADRRRTTDKRGREREERDERTSCRDDDRRRKYGRKEMDREENGERINNRSYEDRKGKYDRREKEREENEERTFCRDDENRKRKYGRRELEGTENKERIPYRDDDRKHKHEYDRKKEDYEESHKKNKKQKEFVSSDEEEIETDKRESGSRKKKKKEKRSKNQDKHKGKKKKKKKESSDDTSESSESSDDDLESVRDEKSREKRRNNSNKNIRSSHKRKEESSNNEDTEDEKLKHSGQTKKRKHEEKGHKKKEKRFKKHNSYREEEKEEDSSESSESSESSDDEEPIKDSKLREKDRHNSDETDKHSRSKYKLSMDHRKFNYRSEELHKKSKRKSGV
ncbi:peptidyl-prolyl cis-trans isomerase sig-7 isoform X2 [Orussus abietinus]|uniref:peptidyl-prolyl cis-trans isomerase sig-7 isoform X2 n=1 Tax=Orussus abietinus TaxID=222816 RepID=UPI000625BEAD|nr:peptidyl-prolyl cis-trans isomerase sig-7 isoform X2 [Orussus abietinus]